MNIDMEPIAWATPSLSRVISNSERKRLMDGAGLGGEFAAAARTAESYSVPLYGGALEKEAARYRWLREWVYKDGGRLHCQGPVVDDIAYGDMGEALDWTIDAAIALERSDSASQGQRDAKVDGGDADAVERSALKPGDV